MNITNIINIFKEKKYLIIAFFIVLIIITIILYSISFKKETTKEPINSSGAISKITSKSVQVQNIEELKNKIFYPFVYYNKIIYLGDKGTIFYEYDTASKQSKKLIDKEILGINKIVYSTNGLRAIVDSHYPKKNINVYNFADKSIKEIDSNIIDFIWSQNSDKLAYLYNEKNGKIQINIADPEINNWQTLLSFEANLYPPVLYNFSNNIIYYGSSSQYENSKILTSLNIDDKSNKESDNTKYSYAYNFSPKKDKALYKVINNQGQIIYKIINLKNYSISDFNLDINENDKIIWKNNDKILIYKNNEIKPRIIEIDVNSKLISSIYNIENTQNLYSSVIQFLMQDENTVLLLSNQNILYKVILD